MRSVYLIRHFLFRHLQGLQHLVKGRAEIKRLAEFAACGF
jgi:hypothetical protein